MVLAGYEVIRTLFSGRRSMAQIYIDGSIWYIPDDEFQGLLDKMVEHETINMILEGEHKIPVYKFSSRGIGIYRGVLETDEYRQWKEAAQAILTDFAGQEFNKQSIIEKYQCTEEQARFYLNYLRFDRKIEYIYDKETDTGVWVIKAGFIERVGRAMGLCPPPAKLER